MLVLTDLPFDKTTRELILDFNSDIAQLRNSLFIFIKYYGLQTVYKLSVYPMNCILRTTNVFQIYFLLIIFLLKYVPYFNDDFLENLKNSVFQNREGFPNL